MRQARDNGAKRLLWQLDGNVPLERFRELATGALLAAYRFSAYKAALAKNDMKLVIGAGANATAFRRELKRLVAIDGGVSLARDLANLPANDKTPELLAAAGKQLAERYGLQYKQLNAKQLAEQGYAGITAVGQGSAHPPVLFTLTYKPKEVKEGAQPLCLVGKGLTFDSGGLSIKPWEGMWDMKADMGGAACVLGAMQAIAELGLPVPVTVVVGSAENMPDGRAYRPGDIIRYKNQKTVETHSTDAEGRLVLADALLHAQDVLGQTRIIVELSTLTGACARALGRQYIGLMSRAPELAGEVLAAGKTSGDLALEVPLHPEYRLLIGRPVADFKNVGGPLAGAQHRGLVPPGIHQRRHAVRAPGHRRACSWPTSRRNTGAKPERLAAACACSSRWLRGRARAVVRRCKARC